MRVTVRMFARLRELSGTGELACDVPPDATVADVWRAMVREHPALDPFGRAISCARNAEFARMTDRIAAGDEVAFLPPVSGG